MKASSPFFARITRDILAIVASVPAARLVTFKDIASHLDVQPRQVAYVLATLEPPASLAVPWHRAVPEAGVLLTPKTDGDGVTQAELLAKEGVAVAPDGRILDLPGLLVEVASLPHGVPVQTKPADAPVVNARRQRIRPRER